MTNYASILAGGAGLRFAYESNVNIPKQLVKLHGRTVLETTIDVFENHPDIDKIIVVMNESKIQNARDLVQKNQYEKVIAVIPGGETRFASSKIALDYAEAEEAKSENTEVANILIHDAVRPYATADLIARCVESLKEHIAAEPTIMLSDTIVKVKDNGKLLERTLDRSEYRLVQTPQAFRLQTIIDAYISAAQAQALAGSEFTDDISVLEYATNSTAKIGIVEGEHDNIKITFPSDLR